MPSLAQGYGRGLLFGIEQLEKQQRMKQADLLDEIRRGQLQDMEVQRKGLLFKLKEAEFDLKEKEASRRNKQNEKR